MTVSTPSTSTVVSKVNNIMFTKLDVAGVQYTRMIHPAVQATETTKGKRAYEYALLVCTLKKYDGQTVRLLRFEGGSTATKYKLMTIATEGVPAVVIQGFLAEDIISSLRNSCVCNVPTAMTAPSLPTKRVLPALAELRAKATA